MIDAFFSLSYDLNIFFNLPFSHSVITLSGSSFLLLFNYSLSSLVGNLLGSKVFSFALILVFSISSSFISAYSLWFFISATSLYNKFSPLENIYEGKSFDLLDFFLILTSLLKSLYHLSTFILSYTVITCLSSN